VPRRAVIALACSAVVAGAAGCGTSGTAPQDTSSATAASTASASDPEAGGHAACDGLGGTIEPDQICHANTVASSYELEIRFPVDYPDLAPVTDFVAQTQEEWTETAQTSPPQNRRPYLLAIAGTAYRSGTPESGTRSVVLAMNSDFGAHPVSWFKAFNYDLTKRAPITFDTLFKPGSNPLQVLSPIVKRELEKRGARVEAPFDNPGVDAYQNFAITDDAVIFFFGQGQMLPQVAGPQRISVPKTEIESLLG
jgi:hypothetical protein